MYSICFADLSQFLLDEIMLRRLEAGGVDNFDTGDAEQPEEPDVDDYVNQPPSDRMVSISKKRLAELLVAHNFMEFYHNAKVSNCWDWYGVSLEADPKANNLLDRLDINDIENMLEEAAEKGTLTPDWYPTEPRVDMGDPCKKPGCTGKMDNPSNCDCSPTTAPCQECRKGGMECSVCGARETEFVPAPANKRCSRPGCDGMTVNCMGDPPRAVTCTDCGARYADEVVKELPKNLTFDPPAIKAPDVNGPPGAEEGETCRRDKCDGKMGYKTGKCGCNWPGANPPCSYCTEGPYCDTCDAKRDDDNQPTRDLPPKGKWWLVFDPKRCNIIGVNGYGRFFRERETAVFAAERYALDTREICFVVEADCMIVPPKQSCTVKKI